MKFHKREIPRGVYGELSKIKEELEEAYDAEEQKQDLMLLIELADIVGAAAGVSEKYGMSLDQLVAFAKLRSQVAQEENKKKLTLPPPQAMAQAMADGEVLKKIQTLEDVPMPDLRAGRDISGTTQVSPGLYVVDGVKSSFLP